MPSLNEYMQDLQTMVHDQRQGVLNPGDLRRFINLARREVAMRTQCLRVTPKIAGSVVQITLTNGGHGYTSPTVVITPPDYPDSTDTQFPNGQQATATAIQVGGVIQSINVTLGGAGYFQPSFTIVDPTGSGCTGTVTTTPINQVVQAQEEYPFSAIDLTPFPGFGQVFAVLGMWIIYSNYRYALPTYDYISYQAFIRQYPYQYTWVPTVACQRGQGTSGTMMVYPIPSQSYQLEQDCLCLPADLNSNDDFEALPSPWTDGIAYYAAYRAYLSLQNWNAARAMEAEFDKYMSRYGAYSRPSKWVSMYGRY